ncbi:MAG: DUF2950 family protein [Planctomycetota bacterium]|jgi:hypothetical protein
MRRLATNVALASVGALAVGATCYAVYRLAEPQVNRNDVGARALLQEYRGAQEQFRRMPRYGPGAGCVYANPKDGLGFPDLWRVGGPFDGYDDDDIRLVTPRLARATSPLSPVCGYWFVDITAGPDGPYDFTKDCGLCAVPTAYGKSGIDTLIVNVEGMVYRKDTRGVPVTVWPDVEEEGWIAWD